MTRRTNDSGGRGIVLDVSQEIINAAVRRDSSHCVIADALRAAVPDARRVSVDLQTIRYTLPGKHRRYVYLTPAPAQEVLVKFDQGHKPEPFLMRLGRPAQIVKTDTRPQHDRLDDDPLIGHDEDEPTTRRRVSDKPHDAQKPPLVLGGKTPPTAALSSTRGRRRTFGLKSLKP